MKKLLLCLMLLLFAENSMALEFQWKFIIPTMENREAAVAVYELLDSVKGVYDIEPDIERNSVMFFFDDEKTSEDVAKKVLTEGGYPVEKMMLLKEPKEGVMN